MIPEYLYQNITRGQDLPPYSDRGNDLTVFGIDVGEHGNRIEVYDGDDGDGEGLRDLILHLLRSHTSTQRSDSAPKWSLDPPTKDGWYWVRGHVRDVSEIGIEIVEVNKGRVSFVNEECSPLLSVTRGCSWYGPLQEPA